MVGMADEPRESAEHFRDVLWVAAKYGDHADDQDDDGQREKADASEREHDSLPRRPHATLAAVRAPAWLHDCLLRISLHQVRPMQGAPRFLPASLEW